MNRESQSPVKYLLIAGLCISFPLLLFWSVVIIGAYIYDHTDTMLPDSGNWYCDDLMITLNFDGEESTAVINGIPASCDWSSEHNTNILYVSYQSSDEQIPGFYMGKCFFSALTIRIY